MRGLRNGIDLSGSRVVVTGAARGLGRAIAQGVYEAGADVVLAARDIDEARATARAIAGDAESRVLPVAADITAPADLAALVELADSRLGGIDVLINNAAVPGPVGPLWENPPDDWWRTMEVNLLGTVNACQAVIPGMIARGAGRIVTISSHAGHTRWPNLSAYSVSKGAVNKLTENLALELLPHGVRAFSYHPGIVATGMTETGFAGGDPANPWQQQIDSWLRGQREIGRWVPLPEALDNLLRIASGEADALTGRYLTHGDSISALAGAVRAA
jgi:NAD(P)-dependent dehydrogenase (short-subunit alcohol dehydrogenase family)